ncbi:hypothetical protein BN1088_1432189 [Sphingobacterium sp. PM2-P1-29]|nr:hypothetical protein BN1088_1432189 [Sphingobacterium sp. PM2-P1-29]
MLLTHYISVNLINKMKYTHTQTNLFLYDLAEIQWRKHQDIYMGCC